jgi:predicted dehydrogenase
MLRIGLIGAGWVTQYHLLGWQRQAGRAKVVAIADPSLKRAEERAQEFDIEHVFSSGQDMLENSKLDAVDIAAPREFHADLVRMVAARGLPVICQKPLAPTYEEACALVAEVSGKTRLMVHENWRFRSYYRQIGAWLEAGRVGPVLQAQMTLLTSGLLRDAVGALPAIERQPFLAHLDRALVMEVLIHHIDTLRFMLGDLTLIHSRLGKQCEQIIGEDWASLVFSTRDGAVVSLTANLCTHGEPPVQTDQLLLIGAQGTIRLDGSTLRCHGSESETISYDLHASYLDSYAAAIGHFIDCLLTGSAFETSAEDNLSTLALVEKIYARGHVHVGQA